MYTIFICKVKDEIGGFAKYFVSNDQIVVIIGDNIFENDIFPFVENLHWQKQGVKLIL